MSFGKEKHLLIESISTAAAPFTRAFGTRKFLEQVRGFKILASIVKLVTHSSFSKAETFSVSKLMNNFLAILSFSSKQSVPTARIHSVSE